MATTTPRTIAYLSPAAQQMARGAHVTQDRVVLLIPDGLGPKDVHDVLQAITGTRAWTITGLRHGYATYRPEN